MSRIGKKPVTIPEGVTVQKEDEILKVKGPKGELSFSVSFDVNVEVKDGEVVVEKKGRTKLAASMWGTTRAMIQNMITGVTEGFKKELELQGVGYKMEVQGKKLVLNLGYSHPIEMEIPKGLSVNVEKEILTVEGIDKQMVGEFAAVVRLKRKVEPYKGKGFRYVGEEVIRKEGKKAVGTE